MKYAIVTIFSFFIAIAASAKCASSGISLLSGQTLNRNGLIILEFFGSSQPVVAELNKKYPIYLELGGKKVSLTVIETLSGEMLLTQVVLKPAGQLEAGKTYALQIKNLPKQEQRLGNYNYELKKWEDVTFKVNNSIDIIAPVLSGTPVEKKKTMDVFGCGPARWVYFGIDGQDQSELFVRASVKNSVTGKITTYIVAIENGMVKLGHGMCSGAFAFNSDDKLEVSFQLFDQSGNKGVLSNAVAFTRPVLGVAARS